MNEKNPLFDGLPEYTKDPKNYKDIESQLFDVMQTDHKHRKMTTFVKCESCQEHLEEKRALLKSMGFESQGQYLEWRKVMGVMIKVNEKESKTRKKEVK